jgi:hypothetical protein
MRYLSRFARFWYDFVVGDDWTIAAAVAVTLALLLVLARIATAPWWLLPSVVVVILGASLWRAALRAGPAGS